MFPKQVLQFKLDTFAIAYDFKFLSQRKWSGIAIYILCKTYLIVTLLLVILHAH